MSRVCGCAACVYTHACLPCVCVGMCMQVAPKHDSVPVLLAHAHVSLHMQAWVCRDTGLCTCAADVCVHLWM